ncbi:hypothetical protein PILCRDRAFT_706739 [Piloderma croceum F 1598]|uniref:Uncharacterized protein n=1 Tax=Piloderma croceum (strain F 1598) TaxID=765440 RepID=A0A0C3EP11_PILCF|nr:hypothetical protein PILCRDRAFT_706739 [Piloderma croceum F 1598]
MISYLDWHILSHNKGSRSGSDINHLHLSGDAAAVVAGKIGCTSIVFQGRLSTITYTSNCREQSYGHDSEYSSAAEHSSLRQLLPCRDWRASISAAILLR